MRWWDRHWLQNLDTEFETWFCNNLIAIMDLLVLSFLTTWTGIVFYLPTYSYHLAYSSYSANVYLMKLEWIPNLEQLTVFLDFRFVICKIDQLFSSIISRSDIIQLYDLCILKPTSLSKLSCLGHWEMVLHYMLCYKWLLHLWVILTENSFKEPAELLYI